MAGPAIATIFYVALRMTIDAPRHPHCCDTSNSIHCFYRTVAFLTREAGLDVALMCEVNKIR